VHVDRVADFELQFGFTQTALLYLLQQCVFHVLNLLRISDWTGQSEARRHCDPVSCGGSDGLRRLSRQRAIFA
jgi:hypothetical protein